MACRLGNQEIFGSHLVLVASVVSLNTPGLLILGTQTGKQLADMLPFEDVLGASCTYVSQVHDAIVFEGSGQ